MEWGDCLDFESRQQLGLHIEWNLKDKHPDADAWIAASELGDLPKLQALQAKATDLYRRVVRENARNFLSKEQRRERNRLSAAAWRVRHRAAYNASQSTWRAANREFLKEQSRSWREALKGNQEAYQKYLADGRARKAGLRGPPKPRPRMSDDERASRAAHRKRLKREYDRRHHLKTKLVRTEAQRARVNETARIRYLKRKSA